MLPHSAILFGIFSPGDHVRSNCKTNLRNSEKHIRTQFCRNPFHGIRMASNRPLFPARARGRPSRTRQGRVECGYLRANVEDLNQAIPSRGSPTQLCPFISLWFQGKHKVVNKERTIRTAWLRTVASLRRKYCPNVPSEFDDSRQRDTHPPGRPCLLTFARIERWLVVGYSHEQRKNKESVTLKLGGSK